jgi:hypothetical protein
MTLQRRIVILKFKWRFRKLARTLRPLPMGDTSARDCNNRSPCEIGSTSSSAPGGHCRRMRHQRGTHNLGSSGGGSASSPAPRGHCRRTIHPRGACTAEAQKKFLVLVSSLRPMPMVKTSTRDSKPEVQMEVLHARQSRGQCFQLLRPKE